MDEAGLIRLGAGKAHFRAAFHAQRFVVETLGSFVSLAYAETTSLWELDDQKTPTIDCFQQATKTCSSQVRHAFCSQVTRSQGDFTDGTPGCTKTYGEPFNFFLKLGTSAHRLRFSLCRARTTTRPNGPRRPPWPGRLPYRTDPLC